MACEVAAAAEVGQLVLFHHDPSYDDAMIAGMERTAKSLFEDTVAAYEGLEIDLAPRHSLTPVPSPMGRGGRKDVQYAQNG